MNSKRFLSYIIVFLIVVALLLPILSWIFSALGFDCKSLLSDVGWRWMFYNLPLLFVSKWTVLCLSAVIAFGSIIRCGLFDKNVRLDTSALYVVLLVSVLLVIALSFSALHPQSPLLSITGGIKGSPYLSGLPTILIWCLTFLAALYAVQSQNVKSIDDFCELFTYGIKRFPSFIVITMLLSFICSCLSFIIGCC